MSLIRNILPMYSVGTYSATYFNVIDTSNPFVILVTDWGGSTLAIVQAIMRDDSILKN